MDIWDPEGVTEAPKPKLGVSTNFLLLVSLVGLLAAGLVVAPDFAGVLTFAFVAAGWVLSVVLHEFGHAVVAYRAGDTSVAAKGYLTLDPAKYIDSGATIVLPLLALVMGGIGFPGGAVYLRPDLMRSRMGRSAASLAGPTMTAIVLAALAGSINFTAFSPALSHAIAFLAFLQGTALILNLLPVPGLDGYGVIRPYLSVETQAKLRPAEGFAFVLLFLGLLLVPQVSSLLFQAAAFLTDALGIQREDIAGGMTAFHFWKALGL